MSSKRHFIEGKHTSKENAPGTDVIKVGHADSLLVHKKNPSLFE